MTAQSRAERLLERFVRDARDVAIDHATHQLLLRRPDLQPPAPGLPVLVPDEEHAAYELDRLTLTAWLARELTTHLASYVDVDVLRALRVDASWRLIAEATKTTEADARERWGHLEPEQGSGAS